MQPSSHVAQLLLLTQMGIGALLIACTDQSPPPISRPSGDAAKVAPQQAHTPVLQLEEGIYSKPDLTGFVLHNEYDDDGDGDGVNETHIRRYISENGDTAFSMASGERLWAWSLNTKDGGDSDISRNYVIRDSNCDGIFDERYRLDMEFRVPECLSREGT